MEERKQGFFKSVTNRVGVIIAGAGTVATGAVGVFHTIGFTKAGIVAGSWAAKMMSASAIATGGTIKAGSLVAVGQSLGTSFAYTQPIAVVALGGSIVGGKYIYQKFKQRKIKPSLPLTD